ncbi:MAG: 50S ribosomal protein L6, partial [Nitrosopumilus sp. YT1]
MSTKQLEKFQDEVIIPEGVKVTQNKHMLGFEGPLGKTFKSFRKIPINIEITESKIILKTTGFRKRDYSILHTA